MWNVMYNKSNIIKTTHLIVVKHWMRYTRVLTVNFIVTIEIEFCFLKKYTSCIPVQSSCICRMYNIYILIHTPLCVSVPVYSRHIHRNIMSNDVSTLKYGIHLNILLLYVYHMMQCKLFTIEPKILLYAKPWGQFIVFVDEPNPSQVLYVSEYYVRISALETLFYTQLNGSSSGIVNLFQMFDADYHIIYYIIYFLSRAQR
jgi:hypothetical protein